MRNVGKGRTAASVVLVGLDHELMGQVREHLSAEAVLPSNPVGFDEAASVIRRNRPDVVIVSFESRVDDALGLAQNLQVDGQSYTLVALAKVSNANSILAAMRVGYKEFAVLPDDAARLRQAVHDAAFAPDDDDEKGTVIAMVGAKGGVGTTFLATNLGSELAGINSVICLDLDFVVGDMAPMMDLSPKDTIIDLLPKADRLDERMLTGAAAVHRSKVHVLSQADELDAAGPVHPDDIYAITLAAAKGYQYVIADVGSQTNEAAAMTLTVADLVVLVTTPDFIAVRDCIRRLRQLDTLGVERERVRLIVNRASKAAFISDADIERNLALKISVSISDDPKTASQAVNEGKLAREVNRKSEVVQDLGRLIAVLTDDPGDEVVEPEAEPSKGLFSRFFDRG